MENKMEEIFGSQEIMEEEMVDDLQDLIGTSMHLMLDDETEMEAVIIAAFTLEQYSWAYIALLPLLDDDKEEETDVILYRLEVEEDGSPILGMIETDEEYDQVADAFYKELEKMEEGEEDAN